jgi:hypothetical protein
LNRWTFVVAAYAVALLGTVLLVAWSYAAMRRAERDAEALRGDE